jgi:hypothetical protein
MTALPTKSVATVWPEIQLLSLVTQTGKKSGLKLMFSLGVWFRAIGVNQALQIPISPNERAGATDSEAAI